MPPAFPPAERARIERSLLESGRVLFSTQGLHKTTLDELTTPAGIHKTTFYAFFSSKEHLYLELLAHEKPGIMQRLEELLQLGDDCTASLERLLRAIVRELEENPLVRRLLTHPQELAAVASRVRPEDLAAKAESLLPLRAFVIEAQERGCLVDVPPDVVVGVLRCATLATLHRHDIGDAIYDDVIALLVASIARGLTAGGHAHPHAGGAAASAHGRGP
jgi:AcrR family transcriptional regulator